MNSLPTPAGIMRALAFLSRLPVPDRFFDGAGHRRVCEDAAAFPLAGILIALPGALLVVGLAAIGAPSTLSAALAVAATILVTGALHEDGLADTADGFGGGTETEDRLRIMKDSHIGAYGVIALIGSIGLRVLALAAITATHSAWVAAIVFVAALCAARAGLIWFWAALPPARPGGVAAHAGQPDEDAARIALVLGGAVFLAATLPAAGVLPGGLSLALAVATTLAFARLCRHMIGGQTGDTIGACEQIVQTTLLCGLAMGA